MKRTVIILLAAASAGFASLAGAQAKIGAVNTDLLLSSAPQYKTAQENISAEFGPRKNEIDAQEQMLQARAEKLQKDIATMTELQRSAADRELRTGTQALQLKKSGFEEDFNARRDEEMQKLQRYVRDEISAFAKAQGYDLILAGGVAYASTAYDVTPALLEALKKKAGVAATPAAAAPAAKPPAPATKPPAPAKP
ncbi:MAG: OmpH family outer membrane protein [Steroidobacteraceae bacterium]